MKEGPMNPQAYLEEVSELFETGQLDACEVAWAHTLWVVKGFLEETGMTLDVAMADALERRLDP